MNQKKRKQLREGFTTGAAAAAAAKACITALVSGKAPETVTIHFLSGGSRAIPIYSFTRHSEHSATAEVMKDAGDDPDVTHRAIIGATVQIVFHKGKRRSVFITGGKGVGMVTRPGLEVSPGNYAINEGPRKMILNEIESVLRHVELQPSIEVSIFVPKGEELAEKTFNPRLGIIGGISILGTTGIEKPISHEAWVKTIDISLSVSHAMGIRHIVLTTGRRSERYAQMHLPLIPECGFIQMGDFFEKALLLAAPYGFSRITIVAFFAKAIKMSQGIPHTHASKSTLSLNHLSEMAKGATDDPALFEQIRKANTARHAFEIVMKNSPSIISCVGEAMRQEARKFSPGQTGIEAIIIDYEGNIVYRSLGEAGLHA